MGLPVGAAIVLGFALFALIFQWNWLRGPLAEAISLRIGRPVTITGNLDVHPWSLTPRATIGGLTIRNPGWAGPGPMAVIPRTIVEVRLWSLVAGDVVVPLVQLDHPKIHLVSDASGLTNWAFASPNRGSSRPLRIGRLVVNDGALRYDDPLRRIHFTGALSVDEGTSRPSGGGSAVVGALTVGAAPWAGPTPTLSAPRTLIAFKAIPLVSHRQYVVPLIKLERPALRLTSDAAGRESWAFPKGSALQQPPSIGRLVVDAGSLAYDDARRRAVFRGSLLTDEGAARPGGGVSTIAGELTVGAAPWSGSVPTARAPHVVFEVKALPLLLRRQLVLPLVEADGGTLRLLKDAAGRESWNVGGDPHGPFQSPPIGRLILKDVSFSYDDLGRKLHLIGAVSSSETVSRFGSGTFRLAGAGRLGASPFGVEVTGGPLVNVDAARPYPFDARLSAGATRLTLAGSLAHPFNFAAVSGRLTASGPDLSDLHGLTGLVLPRSPPYQLTAGFGRDNAIYAFRGLQGRVGMSDLKGSLSVDDTSGRPFLSGELASQRLRLVDLAAVFGAAPTRPAGEPLSPAQKATAARLAAENRLLPDVPLDVARARGMDARVDYKAQSVEAGPFPVRALVMKVVVDHGVITANPLDMMLPQGSLAASIRIDGRGQVPLTSVDARLANARLETIGRPSAKASLEGGVFAHARVAGAGDSVRAAASTMSGAVTLAVPNGQIRQKIAELVSMDVARALYLYATNSESQAPIRCGMVDMRAQGGVLTARRMVLDTGPTLITGSGQVDLRNETLGLQIRGNPKGFRLIRLAAPITLTGNLRQPKVGVDLLKAAPQIAGAVAVGVFAAPAAAILPFFHIGEPKAPDCATLMREASGEGVVFGAR